MKKFALSFAISAAMTSGAHAAFQTANAEIMRISKQSIKLQERQRDLAQYFYVASSATQQYGAELQRVTTQIIGLNRQLVSASWAQTAKSWKDLMGGISNIGKVVASMRTVISTAMDFEAVMSKVKALTGANADELAKLNGKARELGATTKFTATQTGEAMTYLGMAGWKTEQILAGIGPMLSLAAAGGTDLARTADILSDDLTAFGLKAEDAAHMADVFAYTITNSNTTVELMGETMKYAAPVARGFGATMEETAALIGLMANAGIKGSQAGTALRAGFLRLAGPPKAAAKEMAALGIDLSDAQRQMEETKAVLQSLGIEMEDSLPPQQKMVSIIKQLAENTSGLSNEQKLAALSAIFGTNAATGWLNVINEGPDKLEQFVNALNNCDGKADELSKTMMDNAQGSLVAMQSAFESVAISIGSAFLPQIKGAAGEISKISAGFAKWAGENPELIATLGELTAGIAGVHLVTKAAAVASSVYNAVKMTLIAGHAAYTAAITAETLVTGRLTLFQKTATIAQWAWNAALSANPIGAAIVAGVAFVGVLKYLYDHCTELRSAWDNWWQGMKTSYPTITGILEGIFKVLLAPYNLVCQLVDKFSELAGLKSADASPTNAGASPTNAGASTTNIEGLKAFRTNADGGIYGRGAFLTTFAENSGESAIPHTPTARNIGLLARTNEIMGGPLGGDSYSIPISITVNGSADTAAAQNIGAQVEAAVRRALDNIANRKARVSYA